LIQNNINPAADLNTQQSTNNKTPIGGAFQKDKIQKILKFEKIMKKFCKDIGLDKKTLLTMLLGEGKEGGSYSSSKD
jgi:hypothetical protein